MSIIPRKHNKKQRKQLFLFDPITTERKPVDYDYLDGLVDIPSNQLSVYICKKKPLYQLGAFLVNEDFTHNDFIELMTKWRGEEVKTEIWKNLPGGRTQVSSLGRFRNLQKDGSYKFLTISKKNDGHLRVKVFYDGVYGYKLAARLVADAFVINENAKATRVWHKNSFQYDNRANNLEWLTTKEVGKRAGESKVCYVRRIDPETGEVEEYTNYSEAARENFMSHQAVRGAIHGRNKTNMSCGYLWELAN